MASGKSNTQSGKIPVSEAALPSASRGHAVTRAKAHAAGVAAKAGSIRRQSEAVEANNARYFASAGPYKPGRDPQRNAVKNVGAPASAKAKKPAKKN
jgi:hypothetical protein